MILKQVNTLDEFFKNGRAVRCSRGEVVLRGDEQSADVFYVGKGHIKVYSINDDGEEYLHIIYKQGDIFPLIQVFKNIQRRVFYEAIDSSVVWKLPKQQFLTHVTNNSNQVVYSLLAQFAEQFNIYADRLDNLQYKTAYERLVYRLLFLAGRFGEEVKNGIFINVPLTHKTLAHSINLTRESVSREMERLQASGLIETKGGHITIVNIKKLSQEFSEPVSLNYWGLK